MGKIPAYRHRNLASLKPLMQTQPTFEHDFLLAE